MVVSITGLAIGIILTLGAVALHFMSGTAWNPRNDISKELLEHRAETVPETDFPEPMNRSIGGGGAVAAVGGAEGEAGELGEGGESEEASSPADIPEDEIEYFEIEFLKEGETIEVANNETILDAGEEEGWDLPYACRQGQCVSCSGQIDGDANELIEHDNQEMLEEPEMSDGYTLTCVAYPRGEFAIETSEQP